MKSYLITPGGIFALMAVLHIWRAIAEWPRATPSFGFILGMTALVAIPGFLAWWAWRLLRRLSAEASR